MQAALRLERTREVRRILGGVAQLVGSVVVLADADDQRIELRLEQLLAGQLPSAPGQLDPRRLAREVARPGDQRDLDVLLRQLAP